MSLCIGDKFVFARTKNPAKEKFIGKEFTVTKINPNGSLCDELHYGVSMQHDCTFIILDSEVEPIGKFNCNIKRVIFNPPATIILWKDGTKSVVKCQNGEPYDAEKGFALAYLKKLLGNDNTFNKEINKWVKYEEQTDKPKKKVKFFTPKTKEFTLTFTADQLNIDDFL